MATSYYGVSVEEMSDLVRSVEEVLKEHIQQTPEEVWEATRSYLKENSFAQCALDIAMHDLYGKRNEAPLYELWGLELKDMPLTNYTIGVDRVEKMVQKMKGFPWPLYKIKLGTEDDGEIVRELRKYTDAVFRVDANGAWTAKQAIENSEILRDLKVEIIEQPLPPSDVEGMAEVYRKSALPLIADESCIRESDVRKCADYFHGVNIKLTKCGGLLPEKG